MRLPLKPIFAASLLAANTLLTLSCGPGFYNRYQSGDGIWHRERISRRSVLVTLTNGDHRKVRPIRSDRTLFDIMYANSGAPLHYEPFREAVVIDSEGYSQHHGMQFRYPDSSVIMIGPNDAPYLPLFKRGIFSPLLFKDSSKRTEIFLGNFRLLRFPAIDDHTMRLKVFTEPLYYVGCYGGQYYIEIRNAHRRNTDPSFFNEAVLTFFSLGWE